MRKGEELDLYNTAKGKKEGVGSRTAKFFCAIAYGRGFIECHHYTERLNGQFCEDYIKERFPEMFQVSANPSGKLFLQDGDPNQNSPAAKLAMDAVGVAFSRFQHAVRISIPSRTHFTTSAGS